MKKILVYNDSSKVIERGSNVFPARKRITVAADKRLMFEISACKALKVECEEDYDPYEFPGPQGLRMEILGWSDDEHGNPVEACPYCDYEAKSKSGLDSHVRAKHPEQYEALKKE